MADEAANLPKLGRTKLLIDTKTGLWMEAPLPLFADDWVPKPVIEIAERLGAEFRTENNTEGLSVLSRLITDPRMESVWQLLYSKRRDPNNSYEHTGEFAYRANFLPGSRAKKMREEASRLLGNDPDQNRIDADLLEAEAQAWEVLPDLNEGIIWSEQDRAVQYLFERTCRSILDIEPIFLADLRASADQLQQVARNLREQAIILESLGWIEEAERLEDIASNCQDQAFGIEPILRTDETELIVRNRGDVKLRTYVIRLSILTTEIFATPLYGVLATLANVVFDNDLMTDEKVRTLLR